MKSSIRTSASLLAILATFSQSAIAASSSISQNPIDWQYSSSLGFSTANSFKVADKAAIIDNNVLTAGSQNRTDLLKCSESTPCIQDKLVIDSYKETLSSDGAIKEVNIEIYNTSFAPAAIEVYSSEGKFRSVDFVDGTKPGFKDFGDLLQTTASGLIEPFTCVSKGSAQCWNEFKYGRYGVNKSEKKLKLHAGDVIRISRGSEPARLYADILEKMDIVELMIAGSEMNPSKKTPLTLKNNFSPELRRKIITGYIKKKMNEKYTWTILLREFGYETGKKPLNNPLDFFNNAVEVAKNIPADFLEATTDGTIASKVAGDGLSLLVESASKKAALIVDSALFVSQSANIYARSNASEAAYKNPYLMVVAYANPTRDRTVRVPVRFPDEPSSVQSKRPLPWVKFSTSGTLGTLRQDLFNWEQGVSQNSYTIHNDVLKIIAAPGTDAFPNTEPRIIYANRGDFEATVKVKFRSDTNYQRATLGVRSVNGGAGLMRLSMLEGQRIEAGFYPENNTVVPNNIRNYPHNTAYLKIKKQNGFLTASYSAERKSWILVMKRKMTTDLQKVEVFLSVLSTDSNKGCAAEFSEFAVHQL
jgi:hypothetical protein